MSQTPDPNSSKTKLGQRTERLLDNIFEPLDLIGQRIFGELWRTFYESVQDAIALGLLLQIPSFIGKVIIGKDFSGYDVCITESLLSPSRYACYIIVTSDFLLWIVLAGRILARFWVDIRSLGKKRKELDMAPINRNSISLYEDAKATFISLLKQMAQVGAGLITMLLLTGGNPSGFIMGLSFCLGVGFVAWSENKRLENLLTIDFAQELPPEIHSNKKAILRIKINLTQFATHQSLQKLIKQIEEIETNDFLELAKVANLNLKENLYQADLRATSLKDVNLSGANLSFANLSGANLSGAILSGVNLMNANLNGTDLSHTNLYDSDLRGANLKGADLRKSLLIDANLKGAYLKETNVEKARFGDNKGLSEEMIEDLTERGAIFIDLQDEFSKVKINR